LYQEKSGNPAQQQQQASKMQLAGAVTVTIVESIPVSV
jgi:hypothetical protein